VTCGLCGVREATVSYGFEVCEPCRDLLVKLGEELRVMEEQDPGLKEIGDRIRDVEAYLRGEVSSFGIHERSVARMRDRRRRWRSS
jgi:hypothetical protein